MTCSSHSDSRGDSGLLVGQVCRSGQLCRAKTCWHGDAGPWKVLESVAAGTPSPWAGLVLALPPTVSLQTCWTPATARGQDQPSESGHTQATYTHTHTHLYTHTYPHTQLYKHTQTNIQAFSAISVFLAECQNAKNSNIFSQILSSLLFKGLLLWKTKQKRGFGWIRVPERDWWGPSPVVKLLNSVSSVLVIYFTFFKFATSKQCWTCYYVTADSELRYVGKLQRKPTAAPSTPLRVWICQSFHCSCMTVAITSGKELALFLFIVFWLAPPANHSSQ